MTAEGTRVIVMDVTRTKQHGRGTYLGMRPLPGWSHPDELDRYTAAVQRGDARPQRLDITGYLQKLVDDGKLSQAAADVRAARNAETNRVDRLRPLRDRAWQLAAFGGLNPLIALDAGGTVWGAESWWAELDDAPADELARIEALPLAPAPNPHGAPVESPWAWAAHPDFYGLRWDVGSYTPDGAFFPPSAALLSPCGNYRYALSRTWDRGPHAVFIMLNPSTADGRTDDATIRRCIGFARREGCAGLMVVNAFAWRATHPAKLAVCPDPVGQHNDRVLLSVLCSAAAGPVIAAWGGDDVLHRQPQGLLLPRILGATGVKLQSLGPPTKHGHPRHPLRLHKDTPLRPYTFPI